MVRTSAMFVLLSSQKIMKGLRLLTPQPCLFWFHCVQIKGLRLLNPPPCLFTSRDRDVTLSRLNNFAYQGRLHIN